MTIGAKRIATNAFLLSLSSVMNLVISLVTTSLIAKSFGPEQYGKYTFGLAYIMVFTVLANFGIESLFVREAARDPTNVHELVMDVFHLKLILALLTVVTVVVSVNLLNYPETTVHVIYVLSVGLFFQIMSSSLLAVYRSQERMAVIALFNVVFRLVTAVFIVASVFSGIGLMGVVASYSVGCFVVFVGNVAIFRRDFGDFQWKLHPSAWRDLITRGRAFYLSALFGTVYLRLNLFILSKMETEVNLGYYMAAWTLVETLYVFPEAVTGALFPAFSRLYGSSIEALEKVYVKMVKYILIISAAGCAGCIMVGDEVLLLIFGEKFNNSVPILNVLIFVWAIGFLSNMMGWLLYAIKKEATHVKVMGIGCVFNFLLNLILIDRFGYIGSAFAMIFAESFLVISMALVLWNVNLRIRFDWKWLRLAAALASMVLTVKVLMSFNVVVQVAGGAATYLLTLYLCGVLDRDEVSVLRSLVQRRA